MKLSEIQKMLDIKQKYGEGDYYWARKFENICLGLVKHIYQMNNILIGLTTPGNKREITERIVKLEIEVEE